MSYGSPVLRQHVVEFIRGTGQVTDGVVDATTTSGPWTWAVPAVVASLDLDMVAPGAGGGGGAATAGNISAGGGGGGAAGMCLWGAKLPVTPGANLTITLGAGTAGGAVGTAAANSGATTIGGALLVSTQGVFRLSQNSGYYASRGANGLGSATVAGVGGSGGGTPISSGGTAGVGPTGQGGAYFGGTLYSQSGGGGGSGNASGTVNGSNGGGMGAGFYNWAFHIATTVDDQTARGAGNNSAGCSRGGGGMGGNTLFGRGGIGGNGGSAGTNAAGYGGGGGGGGADGAGGSGGDGYVRFTYWSQD